MTRPGAAGSASTAASTAADPSIGDHFVQRSFKSLAAVPAGGRTRVTNCWTKSPNSKTRRIDRWSAARDSTQSLGGGTLRQSRCHQAEAQDKHEGECHN